MSRDADVADVVRRLQAIPALRDMRECFESDEQSEEYRASVVMERTLLGDALDLLRGVHASVVEVEAMPPA